MPHPNRRPPQMATLPSAKALMDELRTAGWAAGSRDHEEVKAFARAHGHVGEVEW